MASYLVERLKRKRSTVRSAGKGVERLERSHSAGGDAEQHNRFGSQLGSSGKVKRSAWFGSTATKPGTIRRLAQPLSKDDMQTHETFHFLKIKHTTAICPSHSPPKRLA